MFWYVHDVGGWGWFAMSAGMIFFCWRRSSPRPALIGMREPCRPSVGAMMNGAPYSISEDETGG